MAKKIASFEENLDKLENIVRDLESGNVTLNDSLKKYEEGVKVFKSCKDLLAKAERKIVELTDSLEEEPFE